MNVSRADESRLRFLCSSALCSCSSLCSDDADDDDDEARALIPLAASADDATTAGVE